MQYTVPSEAWSAIKTVDKALIKFPDWRVSIVELAGNDGVCVHVQNLPRVAALGLRSKPAAEL